MKVTFLVDGESPDFGVFRKGETRDLRPGMERLLIKRNIAVLSSSKDAKKIKRGLKNGKK